MTHLLDVSMLVALLWPSHVHHSQAIVWSKDKSLAVCPISELGFIRVSTSPAFNASMPDARKALADFIKDEQPAFIPADERVLDRTSAPTSGKTTDWHLADLAVAHGMKLATLDKALNHPAAVQVV